MSGQDGTGKTGSFVTYFLPYILPAVSAMLISELMAKCTKSTANVSFSHNIPFWNLNTMFLLIILVFGVIALVDNEYMNLRNNGIILTTTLALVFLLSTNPKVSVHQETF